MSHFSLAVICNIDNSIMCNNEVNGKLVNKKISKMLAPFQENNRGDCPKEFLEFNDIEDENRKDFENGTRDEFYDSSSSSNGIKISTYNYFLLNEIDFDKEIDIDISIDDRLGYNFFKKGCKYTVHEPDNNNYIWIEVVKVNEGNHPDKTVCNYGNMTVKKLKAPKRIPFKKYYNNDFDKFMTEWGGYKKQENGRYGFYENPNRKWDWYEFGGRWKKSIPVIMKDEKKDYVYCCQIKDIVHEGFSEDYNNEIRFWELYVEKDVPKNDEEKEILKGWYYKEKWYLDVYKDKKTYAKLKASFTTHAVLKMEDGKPSWYEVGEMGWFGSSGDTEEERLNWEKNYYDNFLKNENPESLIIIVDCHI